MPPPLLIVSQSDSLLQIVDINSHTEWQTVQIQISWFICVSHSYRVVGGLETFDKVEKIEVDNKDRPLVCYLFAFMLFRPNQDKKVYVDSEGPDQPVVVCNLIRVFTVC